MINNKLLEDVMINSKINIKKIEDTSHMLHWDNREAVVNEIKSFFLKPSKTF